jgi:T4 RnlA family RNA ligase
MKKLVKYLEFINESSEYKGYSIPSYEEAVELCSKDDDPFYESKMIVDGFNVSVFNYRLAQYKDFANPLDHKPELKGYEMRGLTFIFNEDGTLFNRYVLLEKFFNINQVPESMYSVIKNYKIKYVNNKEDGSIATFVKLPNGKIVGKSKMGFDNDQANGINRIYSKNTEVKALVNWCLDNDIIPIFEYVATHNRIVLRYSDEDLILLRLRNNKTGKHIDIQDHLDKIGSIKIAPFEDDHQGDLNSLVELVATQIDKEGCIVQAEDSEGRDFFFKLKTPWYTALHGLLTDDIYKENVIISTILDDKIDDVLGQIPEEEFETHERINKIISIVKNSLNEKSSEIKDSYKIFLNMGSDRKKYALRYLKTDPNFSYVMALDNGKDIHDITKGWLLDKTKKLMIARDWLMSKDKSLFFKDDVEDQ